MRLPNFGGRRLNRRPMLGLAKPDESPQLDRRRYDSPIQKSCPQTSRRDQRPLCHFDQREKTFSRPSDETFDLTLLGDNRNRQCPWKS
jgi:hypothetical protein